MNRRRNSAMREARHLAPPLGRPPRSVGEFERHFLGSVAVGSGPLKHITDMGPPENLGNVVLDLPDLKAFWLLLLF